jgi:hypothetical protein
VTAQQIRKWVRVYAAILTMVMISVSILFFKGVIGNGLLTWLVYHLPGGPKS